MGRGGGSHGGGGHSGGRSFGGRGGGFGGSPGRGRGPGFGGPPPGGPRRRWGGPVFSGGGFGWPGPGRRGGFGCSAAIIVIIFILAFVPLFLNNGSVQESSEITVSFTERTAVTGTDTYSEWYLDELNFIDHDTDLTDGLKYF